MAARRSATIGAALVSALLLALAGAPALAAHHEEGEHGEKAKESMEKEAGAKGELAKQVAEKLGAEDGLSGVRAKAMGSTVTLKGTVAKANLRDRAEEIASGVEGVDSVKNEIEVDVAAGGSDTGSGGY